MCVVLPLADAASIESSPKTAPVLVTRSNEEMYWPLATSPAWPAWLIKQQGFYVALCLGILQHLRAAYYTMDPTREHDLNIMVYTLMHARTQFLAKAREGPHSKEAYEAIKAWVQKLANRTQLHSQIRCGIKVNFRFFAEHDADRKKELAVLVESEIMRHHFAAIAHKGNQAEKPFRMLLDSKFEEIKRTCDNDLAQKIERLEQEHDAKVAEKRVEYKVWETEADVLERLVETVKQELAGKTNLAEDEDGQTRVKRLQRIMCKIGDTFDCNPWKEIDAPMNSPRDFGEKNIQLDMGGGKTHSYTITDKRQKNNYIIMKKGDFICARGGHCVYKEELVGLFGTENIGDLLDDSKTFTKKEIEKWIEQRVNEELGKPHREDQRQEHIQVWKKNQVEFPGVLRGLRAKLDAAIAQSRDAHKNNLWEKCQTIVEEARRNRSDQFAAREEWEAGRFAKELVCEVVQEIDTISRTLNTSQGFNVVTSVAAEADKPLQLHCCALVDVSLEMKEALGDATNPGTFHAVASSLTAIQEKVQGVESNNGTFTMYTFSGLRNEHPHETKVTPGTDVISAINSQVGTPYTRNVADDFSPSLPEPALLPEMSEYHLVCNKLVEYLHTACWSLPTTFDHLVQVSLHFEPSCLWRYALQLCTVRFGVNFCK